MDKEGLSASFKRNRESGQPMPRLLGRGWSKPFAFAAGFWFGFGLRRFLDFLLTFVFASHA
jgi:hypothetical protein